MSETKYILTSNGELFHSNRIAYVDLDDGELMHWKYIKKERVNGKWRYYYDIGDAGYIDGRTGKKPSNIKSYSRWEDLIGKDEQDRYKRAVTALSRSNVGEGEYTSASREEAMKRYAEAGKNFVEARDNYMKTPLGKIHQVKTLINKGKKKVAAWLEKVAKKLRK